MCRKLHFSLGLALMMVVAMLLMANAATAAATDAAARQLLGLKPNPSVASVCSGRGPIGSLCGTFLCPCSNGAYSNWCNAIQSGKCSCPFNACDQSAGLAALNATFQAQGRAILNLEQQVTEQGNAIADLESADAAQNAAITALTVSDAAQNASIIALTASDTAQTANISALQTQIKGTVILAYTATVTGSTCSDPGSSISCPNGYTATACSCDTNIYQEPKFSLLGNSLYFNQAFTNGCTCYYAMIDGTNAPSGWIMAQVMCVLSSNFAPPGAPTKGTSSWSRTGSNNNGYSGCVDKP